MRGRVLGSYVLLLALALAIASFLSFEAAMVYQQSATEEELREEAFDFEAALAARRPGQSVGEAVHAYLVHWPRDDRESLVVRLPGSEAEAAGPVGPERPIVRALAGAPERRFLSLQTGAGDARILVSPLTADGRPVGAAAIVHLTEEDRDDLLVVFAILLGIAVVALAVATALAWVAVGRLLRPLREIVSTADAISRDTDLARSLPETGRRDEVGVLGSSFNRMLARLDAAFRRERRFISEASHELRTPITICRGHLEVLRPDADREQVQRSIAIAIDELGRLGRIVEDMTTLSLINDAAFLRPRKIALHDFVREVGLKAETLLHGRLSVQLPEPGAAVRADPHRLTQALLNLLTNAAAHGRGDGPVQLRIRSERDAWRFEVADEGGGLPPEQEESVFRPFHRARPTTAGRGLGLAIVRGVAEAHGGAAGLDNRPGEGATFWIRVPK